MSVIIPTYNRCDILDKCLQAIERQTLTKDCFEIIIVDDGSQDVTGAVAERFHRDVFGNSLIFLQQVNSGQNTARNWAIKEATGDLLLFINDDTIAAPTMLEEHYRAHELHPADNVAVLGRVTRSRDIPWNIFATLHLDETYAQWEGKTELDWRAFITCNLSVKRSFLMKYGLYDELLRYNDDVELGERLSHHGLIILYNPASVGYHDHYLTEDDYLNIARKSGTSLAIWYKRAPHLQEKLATIGFYPGAQGIGKVKYWLADMLVNRWTRPFWLFWARCLALPFEGLTLIIYRKIYKSIEREYIRQELRKE